MKARTTAYATRLRDLIPEWWASVWRWTLMAAGIAAAVYLLLDRALSGSVLVAAAIALLLVGAVITWSQPMAIALMATPAVFVTERLAFGGGGLTVSDAALAAGFGTAILLGKRGISPPMRGMLWANAIYQFATLFTVIVNPFTQNTVEWFHAWVLISGALMMGYALGRAGFARLTLTLMLAAAGIIAFGTVIGGVVQYASGDFSAVYPTWPWRMHKNFAGGALAFMAFVLYVNPDWVDWSTRWTRPLFWASLIPLAMTQSRQAIIGLLVVLVIHTLRNGRARHGLLITALVIPAAVLLVQSVNEQLESQNKFNSAYQRIDWIREVYALWKHSPLFGHGLRYWYVHPTANFQPPQAELEVLATTGIVGLLGFGVMWLTIVIVLWRTDPRFGMLAFGSVLARIVQAQFDLFWVAAQVSIPFLIAGVCLGAQMLHRDTVGDTYSFWIERPTAEQRRDAQRRRRTQARQAQLPTAYDQLLQDSTKG